MTSMSFRLQGEILKFIRQRHFESGERLFSEREFAEKFSTTRAAIREAVTALEALRVVERRPQSGLFLRDLQSDSSIDALVLEVQSGIAPDLDEINDAIELRRILEVQAVRIAAERHNQDDIAALQAILEDAETRLKQGQSIEHEDEKFHKKIAAATRNSLLVRVVNWFYELSRERRVRYFSNIERSRISHTQHLRILKALKGGNPDECAAIMNDHLSQTFKLWAAIVETDTT